MNYAKNAVSVTWKCIPNYLCYCCTYNASPF